MRITMAVRISLGNEIALKLYFCFDSEVCAFVVTDSGVCDTEYAYNTALKIGTALVNYYVPLAVMAVLYGRIFVAIRRRSKLEIWQNAVVVAGRGGNTSSENIDAGTSRRLIDSTKHEDRDSESDADEVGCSSRATDEAKRPHYQATSLQTPTIVVDYVQSPDDDHRDEHESRATRLHIADETENASSLEAASSPAVESRKCVRFLLVKKRGSDSNDDNDVDHIELSSVEPSQCETIDNDCSDGSGLSSRLMHRLRQRNHNGRGRRNSNKQNSLSSDVKAAKQLGVIMSAFCVCFLPYFVCFVVVAVCPMCVGDRLMTTVTWIGYINSTLNPFLYPLCNRQFRISFRRMFASALRVGATMRSSVASSL